MKQLSTLSLILIAVLIGSVSIWWARPLKLVRARSRVPAPRLSARPVSPPAFQQTASNPAAVPFHWSEVKSADYPAFVSDLRAAGCPEQTIREIVTAELHAQYSQKVDQIEAQALRAGQPDFDVDGDRRRALERQIENRQAEENDRIARLVGRGQAIGTAVMRMDSGHPKAGELKLKPRVSLPLVFHEIESSPVVPDDSQQRMIDQLRENFVVEVGGENQNPHDPAYLARWLRLQPLADQQLRAQVGWQVFAQYQLAAMHAANPIANMDSSGH